MNELMLYSVIKTTTERLSDALNEVVTAGGVVKHFNYVGGRDWIIIARGYTNAPGDADELQGWVADMDHRHRRFDEADLDLPEGVTVENPAAFAHLVDPEVEWGDIKYGRYDETRVPTGHEYAGWIEDAAKSWIIFLGEYGAPALYWPRRDAEGGVIGNPIELKS